MCLSEDVIANDDSRVIATSPCAGVSVSASGMHVTLMLMHAGAHCAWVFAEVWICAVGSGSSCPTAHSQSSRHAHWGLAISDGSALNRSRAI